MEWLANLSVAPILALLLVGVVLASVAVLVRRYERCPSNRVLVIYGKTGSGASKCVHGGAAFVWPLVQSYAWLDLEPFVVPIELTNALSQENIRVAVPTTVTAAISNEPGIMQNAAVRLLGLTREKIQTQAQDIIVGQMRAVIATMKIEDINRDRQAFMGRVNEAVTMELEKIGLQVINVNIRDIEDDSGYIKALGRKAAAEAINQANVDVAEQERRGQIGVAERQRDMRVAVAAAVAEAEVGEAEATKTKRQAVAAAVSEAEVGEATATRNKRQGVATLDAEAVQSETEAGSKRALYKANQKVSEEQARARAESAAQEADGSIRVAQENAQKSAEDARAAREQSRLKAEVLVPAEAERERRLIEADAQRQQAIRVAEGDAAATVARMQAEAKGQQAGLDAKSEGYLRLIESCGGAQTAAALLIVERLAELARIQAEAVRNLPIEKIVVWDGGGNGTGGGLSGLGRNLLGVLPPIHDLARQAGLELPEFLGKLVHEPPKAPSPDCEAHGAS